MSALVLVDYGCGKGRVLHWRPNVRSSRRRVELSEDLPPSAVGNIAKARNCGALRAPVLMHHQDATEYEVPKEPLVIYLFNPFGEKVITRVLDAIQSSLRETPRDAISSMQCHPSPLLRPQPVPRRNSALAWAKTLDRLTTRWPMAIYRARPLAVVGSSSSRDPTSRRRSVGSRKRSTLPVIDGGPPPHLIYCRLSCSAGPARSCDRARSDRG